MLQLNWEIGKLKDLLIQIKIFIQFHQILKLFQKFLKSNFSLGLKHLLRKMGMKSLLLKNKIGILIYLLCARKIQT